MAELYAATPGRATPPGGDGGAFDGELHQRIENVQGLVVGDVLWACEGRT